jgi:hypothetical protein
LEHAGIALRFPRGASPNLSLILGGTGARLEDLVGAFAAPHRDGIAGRVRYSPADPRIERRLLSPGAAWIVREVWPPIRVPAKARAPSTPAGARAWRGRPAPAMATAMPGRSAGRAVTRWVCGWGVRMARRCRANTAR